MTFHDASLRSVDAGPALAVSWPGQPGMGTYWRDLDDNDPGAHFGLVSMRATRPTGRDSPLSRTVRREVVVSVADGAARPEEAASRDQVPLGEVLGCLDADAIYALWGGEL